jgi:GDP/UDP-N,N'-diacetylbacillosamine 2-epimerase (hydrolysing)
MRRVLALTAIRSEYFLSRALFQAIDAHPGLELELVVAGAHLSPHHGHTVRAIEADGFRIVDRIESLLYSDRDAARIKGAALELQILSHIVDARRPDWLLGDNRQGGTHDAGAVRRLHEHPRRPLRGGRSRGGKRR